MRIRIAFACVCLAAAPQLRAQTPAESMPINPDRPDLTNSPRLVAPGMVQIESGVARAWRAQGHGDFGSPVLVRIGVRDWFEAQAASDGLLIQSAPDERSVGVGN